MAEKLTISIVTYNNEKEIVACLNSLKKQTFTDFKLIIVDNDSKDQTCVLAQETFPEVIIIKSPHNVGFGAAHNIAFRQNANPWIMVLNPDAILQKECLANLMSATSNSEVGAISPCLLRHDNDNKMVIDTAGIEKTFYNKVFDRGSSQPYLNEYKKSQYVWGVSGACGLFRRQALQEIAYLNNQQPEFFDEFFFMYKEDADLAARLQRKGWKAWYQADAIGFHQRTAKPEATFAATVKTRKEKKDYIKINSYRNHLFYLIKNAGPINLIPSLVYEGGKFAYLVVFERNTLKGIKDVLKNFRIMLKRRYV